MAVGRAAPPATGGKLGGTGVEAPADLGDELRAGIVGHRAGRAVDHDDATLDQVARARAPPRQAARSALAMIAVWLVGPPRVVTRPLHQLGVQVDRVGRRKVLGHQHGRATGQPHVQAADGLAPITTTTSPWPAPTSS